MNTRTSSHTVTFRNAFRLPGWETSWPPGDYTVTNDEQQLDVSFPAFQRIATRIELRRGAETRHVAISADELAAALLTDAEASPTASEGCERAPESPNEHR
jgi:hypothetical protein